MNVEAHVGREPPKTDRVYLALRQRIRDLQMQPGAALRKDDLAAEFGVSKAPVSEAIIRLAEEGLVDVFPQHGSFVAPIRPSEVREALFIRKGLECEAIRRAASSGNTALHEMLDANLKAQEEALDAGDLQTFYELDEALHDAIVASTGFMRARKFLDSARAPLDRMRRLTLPTGRRAQATLREHRWLVEAVKSGDPELAAAAMRTHLTAATAAVKRQLATLAANAAR